MASSSGTKGMMGEILNEDDATADSERVPSRLAFIAPFLRIANEIEKDNPRVAFYCRFYAVEEALNLYPTSSTLDADSGQFMTYLLRRLETEDEVTEPQLARDDDGEIQMYYEQFYLKNIMEGQDIKKPEEMVKIYQTATVLYDVLRMFVPPSKIDSKMERYAEEVKRKWEKYEHYNILPFYAFGVKPAIMELPEIKAAVQAISNVEGLLMPMPRVHDILDWLSSLFGFQKGNVANQREHLILLLANSDVRGRSSKKKYLERELKSKTVTRLVYKIFENYLSWCNYLHCESNLRFQQDCSRQQLELIYISLYLLIWGEASNIRFMPECICYVFHNMANEVYGVLFSNVHPVVGDTYQAAPDDESFLRNVITPIYNVLQREVKRNKGGRASHSKWRNYDDLNEYFWSEKCFQLGWPMNGNADFFSHSDDLQLANERQNQAIVGQRTPKVNFVEARTFWHLFRSFDRMWIFFVMTFQAMLIVAWNSRSLLGFFDEDVFGSLLTIFITAAFLNFLQATLDIILSFSAWRSLKFSQRLRYLLKFAVAAIWAVVLPISYSSSTPNSTGLVKFFSSWARDWRSESFFSYAVSIYLIPNMLSALLFLLPPLRKSMERSNWRIITLIMWWAQPKLYVGGGMHEDFFSLMKYTLFWIVVIISKLAFSFYVEILPLIQPTKILINLHVENYRWHEFFKNVNHNIGVVIAIWAPVVLVYFVDTQLWYGIFSTLFGGIQGAFSHLGEIRTLGMLGSRFESLPRAFSRHLVPLEVDEAASFSLVWNKFIYSMRMEDLINNRERDLLLVPSSSDDVSIVQWPLFFLASKITIALDIAKDFEEKDDAELFKKIEADDCMHSAIIECYETLKAIMYDFLEDDADKWVITLICYEVEISIQQHRFLTDFRMSELPSLCDKLDKFLRLLLSDIEDVETFRSQIINVLHDIIQVVTQDVMVNGNEILQRTHPQVGTAQQEKKEQRFEKINISLIRQNGWQEKINRLDLLLTDKESSINVPLNLEALRRITFFANSLFMNMPRAPKVRDMLSFSVLTPYYREDVLYSDEDLNKENEDGISILFYLQKIYPDEWNNFLERMKQDTNGIKDENEEARIEEETGKWVSYRGQTLSRTVRGMMYYRQALKLQCFLEFSGRSAIFGGYEAFEKDLRYAEKSEALANMKFTYVISCQVYGIQKKSDAQDRSRYTKILNLMLTYPSLRVAYIDETEEIVNGRSQSIYYSVLVKGGEMSDEEIYRIKLPGPPTHIGEGKPENQNHAIIFTRGEALQTIDMNQDNYFEEAYKMRNVLEEFIKTRRKKREPSILGLREHTFTGSVSSLAWLVSNQQTSFATIGQRIVANPLRVRFHYGHADIFDRIFHITRGGISKASRVINLTGDIFAGFNSILRGGYVTHHEYIQVGKGRHVGMNQLSLFDSKVANGNGEQMLSRDVYRLGCGFDFYRMLSFYFTTVGFYFSSMVMVLTVYVFLYGRFFMVMSGLERTILDNATIQQSNALVEALATQSVFQLGTLLVLPIVMEIGLEKGFRTALGDFIIMQLQLASVFFTFQLGTKAHYFGRTILHGGSRYRATGRGFVVIHAKFAENYRMYSRSHFAKGLELLILLVLYEVYGESYRSSSLYKFITFSMWFLVASWLFAPFVFNPSGFDWHKTVGDWKDWKSWMRIRRGIGFYPDESWESWWEKEQEHLKYTNIRGIVLEIILAFRFFIFQYGIVYHLDIAHSSKSLQVYGLSWVVMVTVLLVSKMVSMNRRRFGIDYQLTFRILKALLFLGFTTVMIVLVVVFGITVSDLFASILAFLPTGWAILLIGQALRPVMECLGFWDSIKELARAYEYVMGLILFMPIAILSWFAVVSELQTRLLFNQAFTRGLAVD